MNGAVAASAAWLVIGIEMTPGTHQSVDMIRYRDMAECQRALLHVVSQVSKGTRAKVTTIEPFCTDMRPQLWKDRVSQ